MALADYTERPKPKTKIDTILARDTADTRTLEAWLRDLTITDSEIERRLSVYSKADGVDMTLSDSTIRRWRSLNV